MKLMIVTCNKLNSRKNSNISIFEFSSLNLSYISCTRFYSQKVYVMDVQRQQGSTSAKGKKRDILETRNERVPWLDEICKKKRAIEEIIALIIAKIEAEPVYYENINKICNHLNQIIKFFYRNQHVRILLFGSSVTKLALHDSDVDIYLDFGGNLPEPPEKLVITLKNKVRKYGYFTKAIPIFARVPIVHCVHQSKISCDLSFLNVLGVSNSNLVKFLVSTDERIRPLILILKFVMKNHGFLGRNGFTSYALIILIVFFLQALQNPIIPSISYIQNLASKRKIVADWDTSFSTDISSIPVVNNQLSVVELLQKFFEFYSTFEFGFYIISSFTGKSYLKPVFSNPDSIPQEFYLYKENLSKNDSFKFDYNKFLCVQGPFNHGNNITRNIKQKSLVQFQNLCWVNAASGKELLGKNKTDENKQKYLISLFDQEVEESSSKKQKKEDVIIFVGEKIDVDGSNWTEENLRNAWSKHVFNSVMDILCKVMKCDVCDLQSNSENDSSGFANDEKLIKCEIHFPEIVSKKRNEARCEFDFPQNMTLLEKEEMISNYLCDTVLKNIQKTSLKFDITCRVKKNPTCFCMDLNSKESQKSKNHLVQQIFHFIKNNFPKWVK